MYLMTVASAMVLAPSTSVDVRTSPKATATATETNSTPWASVVVIAQPMPMPMAFVMTLTTALALLMCAVCVRVLAPSMNVDVLTSPKATVIVMAINSMPLACVVANVLRMPTPMGCVMMLKFLVVLTLQRATTTFRLQKMTVPVTIVLAEVAEVRIR